MNDHDNFPPACDSQSQAGSIFALKYAGLAQKSFLRKNWTLGWDLAI